MTVLLVEDEPDARDALARGLAREGFPCAAASSADEAIAASATIDRLDAVVLDVRLGSEERGGLRALRELRAKGVRAPFVVITAFADVDVVKQALNQGASYLLEKPFRAGELAATLRRVMAEPRDIGFLVEQVLAKAGLTDKEASVARLVLKGLTSVEIAELEGNSDKTIRQHLTRVYAKCGVTSRAELFHLVFPW